MEGLLRISDYHRRELLRGLRQTKRNRELRKAPSSPGHSYPSTVPEEEEFDKDKEETFSWQQSRVLSSQDSLCSVDSPSRVFNDLPPVSLCSMDSKLTLKHWT